MNHHTIARSVRRSVVAGGIGLGVLLAAGSPALAQTSTYGGTGTPPGGQNVTRPVTQPATQVRGVTQTRSNQLPVTGGDVAGLAAAGAGLLAVGVVAVKGARRSTATA